MVVEELLAKLGFDFDDKDLKKFEKGMTSATKVLAGVASAAGVYAIAMFKSAESVAKHNDKLGKQAETLGITAAELQSFQYAAEKGGASASDMSSSMENLAKTASQASRGIGGGVETFAMLGISVNDVNGKVKDSATLMMEVAGKISKLDSNSQKMEFLSNLGISNSLLLTLNQGAEKLNKERERAKNLGFLLSESDVKNAADFNDNLLDVHRSLGGMARNISSKMMPTLNKLMKSFIKWFIANKKLIEQNITSFFNKLNSVLEAVWNISKRVWNVIDAMANAMGGWKNAIAAVGTALLIMNAKAMLIPIVMTAIAVGIGLLLEDLIAYFNGADSAIGDLVKKFPMLGTALNNLKENLKFAAHGWELIFTRGGDALDGLLILIKRFYNSTINYFKGIGQSIKEFFLAPINKAISLLNELPGIDISMLGSAGATTPIANQSVQGIVSNVRNNNMSQSSNFDANITVNVSGSADGKALGQSIRNELEAWHKNVNKKAQNNLRGAVAL